MNPPHAPGYYFTRGVPGKVVVITNAFVNGATEAAVTRSDGRVVRMTVEGGSPPSRGFSVAEWRRRMDGDEFELRDYFLGQAHPISLRPWADADPDTTYVRFDFHFVPDEPLPPGHPLHPPPPAPQ